MTYIVGIWRILDAIPPKWCSFKHRPFKGWYKSCRNGSPRQTGHWCTTSSSVDAAILYLTYTVVLLGRYVPDEENKHNQWKSVHILTGNELVRWRQCFWSWFCLWVVRPCEKFSLEEWCFRGPRSSVACANRNGDRSRLTLPLFSWLLFIFFFFFYTVCLLPNHEPFKRCLPFLVRPWKFG